MTVLCATTALAAVGAGAGSWRDAGPASGGARQEALAEARELQEPADAMLARQLSGARAVPSDVFARAAAAGRRLEARTAATAPGVAAAPWTFVGPTNIGGRILDLALDPAKPNTLYAAAASGGVWKSANAGRTFEPAWPASETQAIGALVMTPSGTLYAGTGESGPGGGSLTYGGNGMYRSKDRGETWQSIGLQRTSRISRIAVDPTNERRIFVAASGPLHKPSGDRGLYRSQDGGESWERVLTGDNATTGASDIAIDPTNPRRIYATMWDHIREYDRRRYHGSGSGVYRSDDGGSTWERIGGGLFGPNSLIGRMGIALAPSAPDTLYVMSSGVLGRYTGFFKSTDGGETWTPRASVELLQAPATFGWWFGRVWVDPKDADHVFVAGVQLVESGDGGATWGVSGGVHADQHAMIWDPKIADRVYLGNDGGVYRSNDNGGSWEFARSQPWSQLYSLDVSQQDTRRLVAGLQDNGVNRSYPGREWSHFHPGDGLRALINPRNQEIVYACYQYGNCAVYFDGGNSGQYFSDQVVSLRKNWFTPIEFDPANPSTLYTGGERMSRSDDDARTWRLISPDLSNGFGRDRDPDYIRAFGTITAIAPAPSATGVIYAGTDDGNLWHTQNGGGTWTKATDPDLPRAWITRVEVDRADPKVAYVTYSGFRSGSDTPYILRTTDGGREWQNITGNLPRAPLNDVNIVGEDLVVASDVGVFLSRDRGASWLKLGRDLPLAPVHELRHHAPTRTLYVATFGRGIWKLDLAAIEAAVPASRARCQRRDRFKFRVPRVGGRRLRSATVYVNGRRVRSLRGRAVGRPLRLRRLRGSRLRIRVAGVTTKGRRVVIRRTYRACRTSGRPGYRLAR